MTIVLVVLSVTPWRFKSNLDGWYIGYHMRSCSRWDSSSLIPPTTPWWDTPHPRRSSPHSITAECLLKCALQWRWMRAGNWLDDIFREGGDAALFKTRGGRPLLRAKNNDVSLLFIMSGLVKARQITSSSVVNRFVKGWQTSKSDYSNILNWLIAEHVGLQYK